MEFYAHTVEGSLSPDDWQKLEDHLNNTADLSRSFAQSFNAQDWGYIVGKMHDIGKYSQEFQQKLLNANGLGKSGKVFSQQVDHKSAGAQFANSNFGRPGVIPAFCIAGHHGGLMDGKSPSSTDLISILNRDVPKVLLPCEFEFSKDVLSGFPFAVSQGRFCFQSYLFIKMLYSCLVDADFLDTEKFVDIEKAGWRDASPEIEEVAKRFWPKIKELQLRAKSTKLNAIRNDIYKDCLNSAQKEKGLFSLTVPTGGGKTLSSMAFAIRHAQIHGMERIIYVIPFTSIIEQNAEVFREFLGDDAVLEHHSNFEPEDGDYRSKLISENWNCPVVVTTSVQFYESFFGNKPSKCRRLHNVVNSVVILDEVQNLPSEYLIPCIELIRELSLSYGCSVVLCSATQPAIQTRDDFEYGLENVREIVNSPEYLSESLKRVKVRQIGKSSSQDIAERIRQHGQVLCVVNTKKDARLIYDLVSYSGEGNYHLSTSMCPAHRKETFKQIRRRLEGDSTCRIISTQLIEAGVDIDLPVVYRAMAGLDSIAQAAGRCNREGKLDKGMVYIYEPENGYPQGHIYQTAQEAIGVIRRFSEDFMSLEAIDDYFRNLYWIKGEQNLDKKNVLESLKKYASDCLFPFRTIADNFKLIEQNTKPVVIPFNDEARSLIGELEYSDFPWQYSRRLQKYTVSLYEYQWKEMVKSGVVRLVADAFPVLVREDLYDENVGLITDAPLDYDPEELIG